MFGGDWNFPCEFLQSIFIENSYRMKQHCCLWQIFSHHNVFHGKGNEMLRSKHIAVPKIDLRKRRHRNLITWLGVMSRV